MYPANISSNIKVCFPYNSTALSDAKGFQPILSDIGFIPCNYVSLHDLLRFGLSGIR